MDILQVYKVAHAHIFQRYLVRVAGENSHYYLTTTIPAFMYYASK